jgi:hypothetical protein
MKKRTRWRVAAAVATALLALALVVPAAAIAQTAGNAPAAGTAVAIAMMPPANATFHAVSGVSIPRPSPPTPSAAAVIGGIAAVLVGIAVVGFVALSLDRRSGAQLRAVEGSGVSNGERPPTQAEDQDRKAA